MTRFSTLSDDPRFQPLDTPAHRQMIDACKKDWLAGMDREELKLKYSRIVRERVREELPDGAEV